MTPLLFVLTLFTANTRDFGAVGDGIANEPAAIQAAADDCKSKLKVI